MSNCGNYVISMTPAGPFPSTLTPIGIESATLAICSDDARLKRLLEFEAALIRALAYCGRVSPDQGTAILDACDVSDNERQALLAAMAADPNVLAPLIAHLKSRAAAIQSDAAACVHFGATDTDAIDCAMKLEMQELAAIIRQSLHTTLEEFRALAHARRDIPSPHPDDLIEHLALPDGLHLAEKAALLARMTRHFEMVSVDALTLCFGSSPETLIRLNYDCEAITERLTVELALPLADHTPVHLRDTALTFGFCLASIVSACGNIAHDMKQRYPAPQADNGKDHANGQSEHQIISRITQAVPDLIAQMHHCTTANDNTRPLMARLLAEWALSSSLALHAIGALDALRALSIVIRDRDDHNIRQMRLNIWDGAQNYIDTQFDQIDLD